MIRIEPSSVHSFDEEDAVQNWIIQNAPHLIADMGRKIETIMPQSSGEPGRIKIHTGIEANTPLGNAFLKMASKNPGAFNVLLAAHMKLGGLPLEQPIGAIVEPIMDVDNDFNVRDELVLDVHIE